MSLTFGLVVAVNNLLALKNFNTFLSNYIIHEKPNWLERKLIQSSLIWLEKQIWNNWKDLNVELEKRRFNLIPKSSRSDFWSVLYTANEQWLTSIDSKKIKSIKELFGEFSLHELKIDRMKKPRATEAYK